MKEKILIVEDNEALRKQIKWCLPEELEVYEAGDGRSALLLLEQEEIDLLLLDLHLPPELDSPDVGKEVFYKANLLPSPPIVIILTGDEDRRLSLELVEQGVFDYILKPIDPRELSIIIKRALERKRLEDEIRAIRAEMLSFTGFGELIGDSPAMREVFEKIRKVATTDLTVLLLGESGTGKELVAREIHRLSKRRKGAFVPVDCGAIPENLLESELFGYEKGAFTGASTSKPGRFELAQGGTLFLDEIGNLSLEAQSKLLRVLEDKSIYRLGSTKPKRIDVRLISASNRELKKEVESGKFREDLFYRLNAFVIRLPPLRERGNDIILLAEYFLHKAQKEYGKKKINISEEAKEALLNYPWPGNVRELQNVIERAVLLTEKDTLDSKDIFVEETERKQTFTFPVDLRREVSKLEENLLRKALDFSNGDRKKASQLLGIDLHQLKYLLKKYNIK